MYSLQEVDPRILNEILEFGYIEPDYDLYSVRNWSNEHILRQNKNSRHYTNLDHINLIPSLGKHFPYGGTTYRKIKENFDLSFDII